MADDHKRFADYIKHWQPAENRHPIQAAAQCTYQQILGDGGDWVRSFLSRRGPFSYLMARSLNASRIASERKDYPEYYTPVQEDDWRIAWFICYELTYSFGPNKQEQEILLNLLSSAQSFTMQATKEFYTNDLAYMVAVTVLKQSQTILRLQGAEYNPTLGARYLDEDSERDRLEECESVLGSLNWAIGFMERMAKDTEMDNYWSLLAFLYLWKSRTLFSVGRFSEADTAVSQGIEVWEMLLEYVSVTAYRKAYAGALSDRGRILLFQEDQESIALAPKLYTKSISLMGDPSNLNGTDLCDYLIICSTASIALARTGNAINVNKATMLSRVNLKRAEKQYHETGDYNFLVSLREALYAHAYAL